MNILFIGSDPTLLSEGSAARARQRAYADEVALLGGMMHIVTRARETSVITDGPLVIHGVRTGKVSALWKLPKEARRLITEQGIAIVSAQDPFEHGWMALRAVRGTAAKLHIQAHTDFLSPWFVRAYAYRSLNVRTAALNRIRVRMAGRTLREAHGIRAVSQRVESSLIRAYGTSIPTPSVLPIAVPTDMTGPVPLPRHPFTFAILAVGRLEPEKRFEDMLVAVHGLKQRYPKLGVLIAGDGSERKKLERMARLLGIEDNVRFLGWRSDARGLMRSANAYMQASAYEGYGMSLIEAALARLPIVTTDVGIVGAVFRPGKDALVTPIGVPAGLAAHIYWLIENESGREKLAFSAELRAREHLAATRSSPRAVIADIARII